ncbi:putative uncharacterized protein DDB_G0271606 [Drosophila obscura]|uniref:putative uncharacterized protein DDB_G0271606 n=1 Tax=Drosophila obscura TaxID=7282 RepID=UPI001BB15311|nr:putative uncharacterized protein DDB_G0271606 [Drosophila obscura]
MAIRLNGDREAMASCPLPTKPLQQQQQQQQQRASPMSFPVTYPYMDAQQLQQYYIAQMQQPAPPMGPNMYVHPWYICQPPQGQSYGYCYGMQMPPNSIPPQNFNPPPNTASMQSTGTLPHSTQQTRARPKFQVQKIDNESRTSAGGRTYKQCSVPLPETACGWCGSINSFEEDGNAQLEYQRCGARSTHPASSPKMNEEKTRQQQQQQPQQQQQQQQQKPQQPHLIKDLLKDPPRDPRKDPHKEEPPNQTREEQKIGTENRSRNDLKEQNKDLDKDKAQNHSAKKHHKKDIEPEKLKEEIDSVLGSGASSFIKRLADLMRHRSTKRKQPKAKPQVEESTPATSTPGSSIVSSESLLQPPRKPSFFRRLFGEVRDNDVAFYTQSKQKSSYPTLQQSDSVEQAEAFNKLRRKQLMAAKGPYKKLYQEHR